MCVKMPTLLGARIKRTIGVLVFYKAKTSTLQKVIILHGWSLVERGNVNKYRFTF